MGIELNMLGNSPINRRRAVFFWKGGTFLKFTEQQAAEIAKKLGIDFNKVKFTLADILQGMNIELEHGTVSPATDITGDDPELTAKSALAHLLETPLYYAPKIGLEAWEASLQKGVKQRSRKTERKTLTFNLEDFDEEQGIFSGYAAVFGNVDSGGDIIEPGAFTKTIAEGWERVKILALHNDCWLPIGKPLELREDSHGLYIKGKISDTSMGIDVKTLLRDRVLNEMSIGYDPVTFDYDKEDGIRHLREVKLWEVSLVTWAMNPEALVTGYKSVEEAAVDTLLSAELADEIVRSFKEERKISTVRLQSLKDALETMETAATALKIIIKEAEAGSDKGRPPSKTEQKAGNPRHEIEITC
jgi:HK97 family phage prohead protease